MSGFFAGSPSHGEITSSLNRQYQEKPVKQEYLRMGEKYNRDVSVDLRQSLN